VAAVAEAVEWPTGEARDYESLAPHRPAEPALNTPRNGTTAADLLHTLGTGYAPCDWDDDKPAPSTPVDLDRIQKAVREILSAVGEDPDREGLLETPARVARMYAEVFAGLHADPRVHLRKTFTQKHDEMVLVKDIDFASCCEHHLVPFLGKAHIAYLPAGKVVGLSKLARVVDGVAKRPQVQERMTEQIAEMIMTELQPRGVGVILEATHMCMTIRGVKKPGTSTVTSAMRGIFRDNAKTRGELLALVYGAR
jgi:GTP cyclohydrolase IA